MLSILTSQRVGLVPAHSYFTYLTFTRVIGVISPIHSFVICPFKSSGRCGLPDAVSVNILHRKFLKHGQVTKSASLSTHTTVLLLLRWPRAPPEHSEAPPCATGVSSMHLERCGLASRVSWNRADPRCECIHSDVMHFTVLILRVGPPLILISIILIYHCISLLLSYLVQGTVALFLAVFRLDYYQSVSIALSRRTAHRVAKVFFASINSNQSVRPSSGQFSSL